MDTNLVKIIILGVIQGISEFLPISSSGHLVVFQELFGMKEAPILVNVVLHGGSLLSIICYYFKDLLHTLKKGERKVILLVLAGTAPAVLLLKPIKYLMDKAEAAAEAGSPILLWVTVFGFLVSFVFLTKVFRNADAVNDAKDIDYKQALLIGIVQAFAVTPGISRSGSTISTAGRTGIAPAAAAKYSFFLGIVAIGGACLLKVKDMLELYQNGDGGQLKPGDGGQNGDGGQLKPGDGGQIGDGGQLKPGDGQNAGGDGGQTKGGVCGGVI